MSDTTNPQTPPTTPAPQVVRAKFAPYQQIGVFGGYISLLLSVCAMTGFNPLGWLDTGTAWAFTILVVLVISLAITIIFMAKSRKAPTDNS